jgi:hypothetical protein
MFDDDRLYFQQRAEVEIERAQEATAREAMRAHRQLAEAYLDRLATLEPVTPDAA